MNICFFVSDYPDLLGGGIQRTVNNLFDLFMIKGHKVICIAKDKFTKSSTTLRDDIYVLTNPEDILCKENLDYTKRILQANNINIIIFASHHTQMFDLAVEMKKCIDVSIISTYYNCPNAMLKALSDDSDIVLFHEKALFKKYFKALYYKLFYSIRYLLRYKFLRNKFNYQYKKSDAFILESNSYRKLFLTIAGQNDGKKLFAIPNLLSSFRKKEILSKEKVILYIARMNLVQKRPDRMLRIWKRICYHHKDWKLYMIGDGDDKEIMKSYSERMNLINIKFIGKTDLDVYYKKAEIMCMTSTYEGFGLILTEALQNAVIPIAFDSYNAIHDIINNGVTGYLIKPFNEKSYASILNELINDSQKRDEIRKNINVNSIEKLFDNETIYLKWNNVFNRCH